jgi:hypothetical protein
VPASASTWPSTIKIKEKEKIKPFSIFALDHDDAPWEIKLQNIRNNPTLSPSDRDFCRLQNKGSGELIVPGLTGNAN